MKLNKKGFVSSAVLYSLLLLFLALILGLLSLLSNRKQILDKLKGDIKNEINQINIYDVYENGTAVYYNPVTGKMCGDYKEENSLNENKTGCMKWYIFNDNKNRATVNMILDHNTTAPVEWNSEETNVEMKEVKTELNKLVSESNWKQEARLITADEVAQITGAKDALSWSSDKTYVDTPDGKTNISYFYLDGKDGKDITWHTKVATTQDASNYAWLYNYTKDCTSFGCNTADSSNFGYWTSTPVFGIPKFAWKVNSDGKLSVSNVGINGSYGVRPVITISKKNMENVQTETVYDYTGKEQQFIVPKTGYYKVELWGAQGGSTSTSAIGGKGAYTSGYIYLKANEKIYIYVGEEGKITETGVASNVSGGYNGGGETGGQGCCGRKYGSGGGATDIRLVNGNWNDTTSLNSRIMVAAGGGGAFQNVETTYNLFNNGGYGGALVGGNGSQSKYGAGSYTYCYGEGATQTSGGKITTDCTKTASYNGAVTGNFGIGGGVNETKTGGGGGYYGGSCSGHIASAGGGSSYISGYIGAIAISSATNREPKSGCTIGTNDIECSKHYSNKIFMNPVMKAGNNSMPSHNGKSTMTGNIGNGYAKITYTQEVEYSYSGEEQQFIVPKTGNYKIETWGAQGDVVSNIGYGGYSKGDIKLDKSSILYIVVGQQGQYIGIGGYNGGGNGSGNNSAEYGYSTGGGGATHIATKSGLLSTLENYKTNILIVSGGGGGHSGWENNGTGGSGGGYIGNESTGESENNISKGGTQISGGIGHVYKAGTFGLGGSILNTDHSAGGGGGGFYGGGCAANGGGGGGSGYIGNTLLTNKVMYCYNCTESTDENTKTVSTTNVSEEPISEYAKKGNGYAKITYLSD